MDGKYVAAGIVSDDGGYSNQAIANHVIMAAEKWCGRRDGLCAVETPCDGTYNFIKLRLCLKHRMRRCLVALLKGLVP